MDAGVVDRHAPALVAFGDVALAPAVTVGVDGQAKGVIAVVDRAADMVVYPAGIAAHIKLEDFEAVAGSQGRSLVLAAGTAVRLAAGPPVRTAPPHTLTIFPNAPDKYFRRHHC
jgi:hypothetical protein